MSQSNLEAAREALLAFGSGDPEAGLVASNRYFDPSIEWDMSGVAGWPEQRLYRGDEVGEFLRVWAESWKDWRFDVLEVRDAGGDWVFAAIHEHGVGADSGAIVDQQRFFATKMRAGRIVRVKVFSEIGPALEAAGVRN